LKLSVILVGELIQNIKISTTSLSLGVYDF